MAATRIYSTLAYYIAGVVAILFGFCPKFGAVVAATPGGVLGGITLVLYGMIGLLGAKIWIENRVDFANPVNLVPTAAGIIAGVGGLAVKFTKNFSITGIAAGTIIVIVGYHLVRWLAPEHLREEPQDTGRAYEGGTMISTGNVETPEGEVSPFRGEFGGDATT
jgi:xanthine/uracil permease